MSWLSSSLISLTLTVARTALACCASLPVRMTPCCPACFPIRADLSRELLLLAEFSVIRAVEEMTVSVFLMFFLSVVVRILVAGTGEGGAMLPVQRTHYG